MKLVFAMCAGLSRATHHRSPAETVDILAMALMTARVKPFSTRVVPSRGATIANIALNGGMPKEGLAILYRGKMGPGGRNPSRRFWFWGHFGPGRPTRLSPDSGNHHGHDVGAAAQDAEREKRGCHELVDGQEPSVYLGLV